MYKHNVTTSFPCVWEPATSKRRQEPASSVTRTRRLIKLPMAQLGDMTCHAMSCHFMSFHVVSCHVRSFHVMSCHVISHNAKRIDAGSSFQALGPATENPRRCIAVDRQRGTTWQNCLADRKRQRPCTVETGTWVLAYMKVPCYWWSDARQCNSVEGNVT